MKNTPSYKEYSEFSSTPIESDVFIPIDLNWRKNYYKSLWNKREWACILDYIITYLILVCTIIILALAVFDEDLIYIILFTSYLVIPFLNSILESSKWRGGFGKKIMRIEITDNFGKSISFWKSIGRNFLKLINLFICLTIIGYYIQKHYYIKTGKLLHDRWSFTIIGERLTRNPALKNNK